MKISKKKIMFILAEKEMSWSDLARSIGKTRQYLSAVVGRGTCALATVGKLAKSLNVPISAIVEEV